MLGERSIDAAVQRGLERQAHEQESMGQEEAFENEIGNGAGFKNEDGDGSPRTHQRTARHSEEKGREQDLQFQNESARGDYSDGPIHSRLERGGGGNGDGTGKKKKGIWGRIARKVTGV